MYEFRMKLFTDVLNSNVYKSEISFSILRQYKFILTFKTFQLNKSVHGEEMPYVLGIPLGGANSHFHTEYTPQEKLLSEVVMRLWTNFVKNG